jgi:hypothetical protein
MPDPMSLGVLLLGRRVREREGRRPGDGSYGAKCPVCGDMLDPPRRGERDIRDRDLNRLIGPIQDYASGS